MRYTSKKARKWETFVINIFIYTHVNKNDNFQMAIRPKYTEAVNDARKLVGDCVLSERRYRYRYTDDRREGI